MAYSWSIGKSGETLADALKRSVKDKTGLEIELLTGEPYSSFVSFYDTPTREPRYHDVAMSFLCKVSGGTKVPGARMSDVKSFSEAEIEEIEIGFDHRQIIMDGIRRLKELGYL